MTWPSSCIHVLQRWTEAGSASCSVMGMGVQLFYPHIWLGIWQRPAIPVPRDWIKSALQTHKSLWTHTHTHTRTKTYTHAEMKWIFKSIFIWKYFLTIKFDHFIVFSFLGRKTVYLSLHLSGSCFQSSQAPNYKDGEIGQTWFHRRHMASSRMLTRNPLKKLREK